MNAADVAYALNLDLDAISRRLHDPDVGPHLQDVETVLYALHSLQKAIHDEHLQHEVVAVHYDQETITLEAPE